ncbi:MAG: hypothetical protein BroJett015_12010 [Chloroflexota bacterium]|nr:hypothetical protein [Ardenticatenaceae bacterium]GIK55538.1 MAG: hypothetical protein BroJett015_12010 [Chloroflexota bacterium]
MLPIETFTPVPSRATPTEVLTPLEQTAHHLAASHQAISYAPRPPHLLARVPQLAKLLQQGYQTFRANTPEAVTFSYAAEWLLDNFYIVQRALQQIEEDLSPAFYGDLPKLNDGTPLQDYPRIYDVARQLLQAEGCQFDLERVYQFVWAYQAVPP